jgi:hypothetical protein
MSYVVSPVYAADAPSSLPVGDVIRGLVGRLMRGALLLGRLVLVSITWCVAHTAPESRVQSSWFRVTG